MQPPAPYQTTHHYPPYQSPNTKNIHQPNNILRIKLHTNIIVPKSILNVDTIIIAFFIVPCVPVISTSYSLVSTKVKAESSWSRVKEDNKW